MFRDDIVLAFNAYRGVAGMPNLTYHKGMSYDERLDQKSGFYRGVKVAVASICEFLRDNGAPDAAELLGARFTATKFLVAYRERSPHYRRKQLRLVKGGKDGDRPN